MSGPYHAARARCLARSRFSSPGARRRVHGGGREQRPRADRAGTAHGAVAATSSGHSFAHRATRTPRAAPITAQISTLRPLPHPSSVNTPPVSTGSAYRPRPGADDPSPGGRAPEPHVTSEQPSLTARRTKRGGSPGRTGWRSRTPPAKSRYRPGAAMVRRLGDLVRRYLRWAVCFGSVSLALGLVLTACAPAARPPSGSTLPGRWARFRHLPGVVDLAGPRSDGSFIVAAAGRLYTLTRAGVVRPFAREPGGYSTAVGPEPYIAIADSGRAAGAGCSFPRGMIFALQPGRHPGIIAITPAGQASQFTSLPATLAPDGITFDTTGRFGHRLVVQKPRRDHGAGHRLHRRRPHNNVPCPGHGRWNCRGTGVVRPLRG
jgi:hypothetical protein